ncbi:hypothetical protein NLJ89_g7434 [Agrocybe chaxingu]|uniref:F-box domain-containing protein n=1 Tax=Agrocybe chaxingu TaxID=84603 RepID=A0A9W8MT47_9AGAR|nr:hypothetical protein NLJ89_g7434 [Agrocybe chaxingu]
MPLQKPVVEAYAAHMAAALDSDESIHLHIWKRDGGTHNPDLTVDKIKWLDDIHDVAPERRGDFFRGNVPYFNIEPPSTMSHNAWHNILSSIRTGIGLLVTPDEYATRDNIQNTLREEIRALHEECGSKLAKVKALCGEIVVLEETIADRERKLGIVSSVTAPIRRLPLELLTRIFRFTLPSGSIKPTIYKSPLALCGVSKLWWDTVVNDPQMWSQIWCHFPTCESAPSEEYDKILQRLECFSRRSGTTPLTIDIFENSSITSEN